MKIDSVSYSFSLGTMTVFVHKGHNQVSIESVEICDRDFDYEEDREYLQTLAEEISCEQGYILA